MPLNEVSQTFAKWQALWGLEMILERWDNIVGDTLARLVACVLLEQKVLLLGDGPRVSSMALLLRSLLWPFKWLHPFLSAPPSAEFLRIPLLDAMFPLIVAVTELPEQWGFRTQYDLPADVVVGMLHHDYVYSSATHETSGGLKGTDIKLPGGRHTAFLKHAAREKQKHRRQEAGLKATAEAIYDSIASEVMAIAQLVRDYAADQVNATLATLQSNEAASGVAAGNASDNSKWALRKQLTGQCLARALPDNGFVRWLMRERPDVVSGQETKEFYSTLSQTQLCVDLLHREISSIVAQQSEVGEFTC